MAQIASKSPWGVPLVLPHVLLSIGLLIFATMSERAASHAQPSATVLGNGGSAVAVSALPVETPKAVRGI